MNGLNLLEQLIKGFEDQSIDIELLITKDQAIRELLSMKGILINSIKERIVRDITDGETSYYAPDYKSWKSFLKHLYQNEDFSKVLDIHFTEEKIEELWQHSHIAEELTELEIKARLKGILNIFQDREDKLR